MVGDGEVELSVTVEAASRLYARTDTAFLEQVAELARELIVAGIKVVDEDCPGKKGLGDIQPILETIVIGGPGLLALCGVAKLWIRQRGDRLLRITTKDAKGREYRYEVDSANFSEEVMLDALKAVIKRTS